MSTTPSRIGNVVIIVVFLWIVGNVVYLFGIMYRERGEKPKSYIQNVAKGIGAIIAFGICALALHGGPVGFLSVFGLIAVGILLVSAFAPRGADHIFHALLDFFDLTDSHAEWILGLGFAVLIGGALYFLLFAPYGVLCSLGLKSCGKW